MSVERHDVVSDAERDQAIAALRHHAAAGLISLDDFAERVERVLIAQTRADLVVVTAALPALVEPAPPGDAPRRWASSGPVARPASPARRSTAATPMRRPSGPAPVSPGPSPLAREATNVHPQGVVVAIKLACADAAAKCGV
jgi:hypothetical protein